MRYYYLTGASRGIGRCLAQELLALEDTTVIGISRSRSIEHPHYRHLTLDLTNLEAVAAFAFEPHPDAERVAFINSAGFIKPRFIGRFDSDTIIQTHVINAVAPTLLTNSFLATYPSSVERVICNLTSGASSNAVPGGGAYGAAKAAVEAMTRTLQREATLRGDLTLRLLVANPGNLDTDMHAILRNEDETEYPLALRFRQMKEDGMLAAPEAVAATLCRVLHDPFLAPDMIFAVADIPAV